MNNRLWLIVSVSLFLAAYLIGAMLVEGPAAAQAPVLPEARYKMEVVHKTEGISSVFVMDVHTGQVWVRSTHHTVTGWTDMGSPTIKKPARGEARASKEHDQGPGHEHDHDH
jgi:hypothetical protein